MPEREDESEKQGRGGRVVRRPAVAGTFYPASAERLAADVDSMLAAAGAAPLLDRPLVALVEPHAGYRYSGRVAAAGYRLLEAARVERVFLVGPSHRTAFEGVAVWDGDAFSTPLGEVPVDREAVASLLGADPLIVARNAVHEGEHALEVQLPFLQRRLDRFRLVPMVMGSQERATVTRLARALGVAAAGPRSLLIASSDLSHYHPAAEAEALDRWALDRVLAFDPDGLLAGLARGDCEACGGGPIAAVLFAARTLGGGRVEVLDYGNSGDVTGGRDEVVGYPACAVTR